MNRVANQGLIFVFKVFSPHPELYAVLLVYDTLAHSSAFRVQLELIWFIVHALLKRYSYLQHCRKSPSQGALTDIQTHSHRHSYRARPHSLTPVTCEGQIPKIRQLLGKNCWFFNFPWKRKKHRGCVWPSRWMLAMLVY